MIDTTNKFAVGTRGESIIVLKWGRQLSVEDALNLAAWIVAQAEMIQATRTRGEEFSTDGATDFDAWLNAVRNT